MNRFTSLGFKTRQRRKIVCHAKDMYCFNKHLTILFVSMLFLLNCSDSRSHFSSHSRDINFDKKADQVMHSHTALNSAVLIETDTDLDGVIDDYLWVNGKAEKKESAMLLYNEAFKNGKSMRQTWFGPGNRKLIEKSDEDSDGFLETTTYFNQFAIPKVVKGIVARVDVDSDQDLRTDLWMFPGMHIEIDKDKDGIPDCRIGFLEIKSTEGNDLLNYDQIKKMNCSKMPKGSSLVLNPQLIRNDINKVVLNPIF